ncbi:hypothetical protein AWB85_09245 [Mycobacteroides immunogenum]|uniref:Uncharacterized protein n=1 Tax=Mycobacteroides immunogenum TaxID=83262 RepID=A0A179V801_9MYCO|nr:hypothetical protein AWB85_09245 [Mycobacteroides immunogenum]
MPTGSHHQPFSQFKGVVDTGGRQMLAAGSHHPPGQLGTIGSAAPIAGDMPESAVIGINVAAAAMSRRRVIKFMRTTSGIG